jgi:hypothetical protein
MVEITCPASARPGEHIEAQTASGRMHVTIPDGVRPGQVFLVRRAPAVGRAHADVEPPSYHPITDSIESRCPCPLRPLPCFISQGRSPPA